jgi:hypothetical protein
VVRLGGEKVPPRDQLVAFNRGVVVDRPTVIAEGLGGATLDTKTNSLAKHRSIVVDEKF